MVVFNSVHVVIVHVHESTHRRTPTIENLGSRRFTLDQTFRPLKPSSSAGVLAAASRWQAFAPDVVRRPTLGLDKSVHELTFTLALIAHHVASSAPTAGLKK